MDNILLKAMANKNMTQVELARIVGVERKYLNDIISKEVIPTISTATRIADALGKSLKDLFIITYLDNEINQN